MIRKHYLALFAWLFLSFSLFGQFEDPVKWETSFKKINDNEYDLIFKAKIEEGWVIYSQYLEGEDGPIPTTFYFDEGDHFELAGENVETGNKKTAYDKVFQMDLAKLYEEGIFTQRVRVANDQLPITGAVEFMTCNDSKCLPPTEVPFEFLLSATAVSQVDTLQEPKETQKLYNRFWSGPTGYGQSGRTMQ